MATKFAALTIGGIDEGRFEKEVNADMKALQSALVKYVKEYGAAAQKAKAKLTIEISLTCESTDDQLFSVKATTKNVIPNRPPSLTMAMAEDDDDDQPALFIRNSGSTKAHPKQGVLHTKDGRPVDPDTGKAPPLE
jgi:hypothetical protein